MERIDLKGKSYLFLRNDTLRITVGELSVECQATIQRNEKATHHPTVDTDLWERAQKSAFKNAVKSAKNILSETNDRFPNRPLLDAFCIFHPRFWRETNPGNLDSKFMDHLYAVARFWGAARPAFGKRPVVLPIIN
jgi:hypothetical protein